MMVLKYRTEAVIFLLLIFVFGICSDFKLADYYINNVIYNEYFNPELGRKNETEYSMVFFGKRIFIDVNGGIRSILGQRYMNQVTKLNNGHLIWQMEYISDEELEANALNIKMVYEYCQEKGVPFVYIAAPDKISPWDSELPTGVEDYSNSNIDRFLEYIENLSIPFIDIRKELHNDGINQYLMFSRTDHHWNGYCGFYVWSKIRCWMDENGIDYEDTCADESNYTVKVYNNKLLGSYGQRTGKYFTCPDDFVVYYPNYDTSLTVGNITGRYEDILLNMSLLDSKEPEFIYDAFYPNYSPTINNSVNNDTRILIIGDSFSREVNPYFILTCKEYIWSSSYQSELISRNSLDGLAPDAMIIIHSPANNLGMEKSFRYFSNE